MSYFLFTLAAASVIECRCLKMLSFVFFVVASVTFHCGIVPGLRNLAKTCSRRLLGPNNSCLTTLQILDAVIGGRIIFHCACAWTFLCFSIWYRWTLLVLYGFLLSECLRSWSDGRQRSEEHLHVSNYFLAGVLRWYFTNCEASVNAWAGVLFTLLHVF